MSEHLAAGIAAAGAQRRSAAATCVQLLGPLTIVGGVVWAFLQPYRVTLLAPREHGFWWLLVEPPLLVVAAGVLFHLLVVPGLLEDLRAEDDEPG